MVHEQENGDSPHFYVNTQAFALSLFVALDKLLPCHAQREP